jgi:ribosome-associated heat shock protein Hsp15
MSEGPAPARPRLDVWLDIACLFKTRSAAQTACRAGKVDINGQSAKPHRLVNLGDEIDITRGRGRRQKVVVLGFADAHIAKAEARKLYEDKTPPPTAEEIEARELQRIFNRSQPRPVGTPGRRDQRALRRLKGIV